MANEDNLQYMMLVIERRGSAAEWNNYKLKNPDIDLTKADFSNRSFKDFNFSGGNLSAVKMSNCDLSGADFSNANLSYSDMRRANLANSFLTSANLSVANLEKSNMVDTNLDFANLSSSRLCGAYMVGSSLMDANLTNANLRGANLKFANLSNAIVRGCNVEDADLSNAQLTDEQLNEMANIDKAIINRKQFAAKKEPDKKRISAEENYEELFEETDCYKILGIGKDASIEDIEKAYKQKAKEYHPDRVHHLGEKLQIVAQREFERIQTAYKSLTRHRSKGPVEIDTKSAGVDLSNKNITAISLEDYLNLIKANPNNDKLYYNLGIKYLEKGFVELAIDAYKKSLQLNPYNVAAQHNLKLATLFKTLSSAKPS